MNFSPLELVGVLDRGIPNKERICIKVNSSVELRKYFLGIALKRSDASADPINDNSFWLGNNLAAHGDWIFVYTGRGEANVTQLPNQDHKVFSLHWGRSTVLFGSPELIPYLFAIESVLLPTAPDQQLLPVQGSNGAAST